MEKIKFYYQLYSFVIVPLVIITFSLVGIGLVIVPQALKIVDTQRQISDINRNRERLAVKITDLDNLDSSQLQRDSQLLMNVLPTEPAVPETVVSLQALFSQSGLVTKNITYGSSRQASRNNSYQLNVTLLGQLPLFRQFLATLDNFQRILAVESIRMSDQGGGLQIVMPISVFYRGVADSKIHPDQPVAKLNDKEKADLNKLAGRSIPAISFGGVVDNISVPLGKDDPFQ